MARDQLAAIRQIGMVSNYIHRFQNLVIEILSMTKDEAKDRYVCGLKSAILQEVEICGFQTLVEVGLAANRYNRLVTHHRPKRPYHG